jgi:hypothetical protein
MHLWIGHMSICYKVTSATVSSVPLTILHILQECLRLMENARPSVFMAHNIIDCHHKVSMFWHSFLV